jgi:hypothetical protein
MGAGQSLEAATGGIYQKRGPLFSFLNSLLPFMTVVADDIRA